MIGDKVTPEIRDEVKAAYGKDTVLFHYKDKHGKYEFIFKPVTHTLLAKIREVVKRETLKNNLLPVEEVNNTVFDNCVVWPAISEKDKEEKLPSGMVSNVVKDIQEKSGFIDVDIFERPLRPSEYTEVIRDFDSWDYITDEEVEKLKAESLFPLSQVMIGRLIFIVRPMTKADWIVVTSAMDDQLTLCKAVTMWPKNVPWDTIPAGYVELLARAITKISGYDSDAEVTEL